MIYFPLHTNKKCRLVFRWTMALLLTVGISPSLKAGGPIQEEFLQFEPVDVSDVVNLATGDFVYSIPVLNLPGPEGDYAMALSYHAGIGLNQEASWVGLGWSLNPGAVNRSVNGYPDDYKNQPVVSEHYGRKSGASSGVGLNLHFGPVGLGMSWDSDKGFGGINSISVGMSGVQATVSNSGIDVSARVGPVGISSGSSGARLSISQSLNEQGTSIGMSLSSSGSLSSLGFSSGTGNIVGAGNGTYSESFRSMGIPYIPIGSLIGFSVSYYSHAWQWLLDDYLESEAYGFLHFPEYLQSGMKSKKIDRSRVLGRPYSDGRAYLFPAQDHYNVTAQGLTGTFMPFSNMAYHLYDRDQSALSGQAHGIFPAESYEMTFRFLQEKGLPHITLDSVLYGDNYNIGSNWNPLDASEISNVQASQEIDYELDPSGKIIAFHVRKSDGTLYSFELGQTNSMQYSWSNNGEITSKHRMDESYVNSWLLTAIKGPDYLDRNGNGECDDSDWGYWVKFNYQQLADQEIWRAPYEGIVRSFEPGHTQFSAGVKEIRVLESVETATHLAVFETSLRKDRFTTSDISLLPRDWFPVVEPVDLQNGNALIAIPGNWTGFMQNWEGSRSDILFSLEHTRERENGNDEKVIRTTSHRLSVDDVESYSYNQSKKETEFIISYDKFPLGNDPGPSGSYQMRLFRKPTRSRNEESRTYIPTYSVAKKLDSILLYSKSDPALVQNEDGNWIIGSGAEHLQKTVFRYDYLLCPDSPNSYSSVSDGDGRNKAKLTLLEVQQFGRNSQQSIPAYVFEYGRGDLNPSYHRDAWDRWGSYRKPYLDLGWHNTDQWNNGDDADLAAAWSLHKITSPLGGTIEVEYESDDYYYVSQFIDYGQFSQLFPWNYRLASGRNWGAQLQRNYIEVNLSTVKTGMKEGWINVGDYLDIGHYHRNLGHWEDGKSVATQTLHLRVITDIDTTGQTAIVSFIDPERPSSVMSFDYTHGDDVNVYDCTIYPRKVYGGGIRVKSLTTSSGEQEYRSEYSYETESSYEGISRTHSSGVTAALPPVYATNGGAYGTTSANLRDEIIKYAYDSYPDDPWSLRTKIFGSYIRDARYYGTAAPGVIYSKVTVTNVHPETRTPMNGKTEYHFATSREYPLIQNGKYPVLASGPNSYYDVETWSMHDQSSAHGMPLAVKYFEQYGPALDSFRVVRKEVTNFTFGSKLGQSGRILLDQGESETEFSGIEADHCGFIVDKYRSTVSADEISYSRGDYLILPIERVFDTPFVTGNRTINYYYPDPQNSSNPDSLILASRQNIWDGFTGQTIGSTDLNNLSGPLTTLSVPAYWRYPGMADKNMLSQSAQSYTFLMSEDYDPDTDPLVLKFDSMLAASVTTWSDHWDTDADGQADGVWRKNDSYAYLLGLDHEGGSPYSPFTDWTYSGEDYPAYDKDNPWRMMGNITSYSRYSAVQESRLPDLFFTCSVYDTTSGLALASVSHARLHEVRYYNYEADDGVNVTQEARTGVRSRGYSSSDDYTLSMPAGNTYTLSGWVLPSVLTTIDGEDYAPGEWQYFEVSGLANNGAVDIVQGSGHIDDVRIYPDNALMSTYAYDPLTHQLTASTDANSITTFYEYDALGNLKLVRDHNGNIRIKHKKYYHRPTP